MASGKWASSNHRAELPINWPKLRAQAKKRAIATDPERMPGGRCEHVSPVGRCRTVGNQCDHIKRGAGHAHSNLQWLGYLHHNQKTQQEAQEARSEKAARGKRTPERHPGSTRRRIP